MYEKFKEDVENIRRYGGFYPSVMKEGYLNAIDVMIDREEDNFPDNHDRQFDYGFNVCSAGMIQYLKEQRNLIENHDN